ncbi:MAG: DUF192 domain-containing protein [Novosphingobium sp.]
MRLIKTLGAGLGIALILAAGGCSPHAAAGGAMAPAASAAVHPISGLGVIPLSVTSAGKVHRFRVEFARSDAEQEKGLMFRTAMGADEGMIFPMNPPRPAAFWMRNTVIPLDIIFIGRDHRILNIAANAVPYDETPLPSVGAASGVLELNGGRAAALGIGPGDRVDW